MQRNFIGTLPPRADGESNNLSTAFAWAKAAVKWERQQVEEVIAMYESKLGKMFG